MKERHKHENGFPKDPPYVYTSRSGRKYIKPNEIVHLDKFRRRVEQLRAAVKNSHLVR